MSILINILIFNMVVDSILDHFILVSDFDFGKNTIIFLCVDNSYLRHTDNRKKDILVLGEGSTQGLDDTTVAAEAKNYINLLRQKRNFV